ncbi:hypothetical protein [Yinghuangia soli]|uniref:DUF3558 domain-containing protein n=1 Tax=Yinghuangia soli TaxID=2908204 RepID=A0AA41Q7B2_9ACTN|nr:hypothetical protein [Yinghuangia soli]MCF2531669.1 hypothetical protein [Yinghuangia soli]
MGNTMGNWSRAATATVTCGLVGALMLGVSGCSSSGTKAKKAPQNLCAALPAPELAQLKLGKDTLPSSQTASYSSSAECEIVAVQGDTSADSGTLDVEWSSHGDRKKSSRAERSAKTRFESGRNAANRICNGAAPVIDKFGSAAVVCVKPGVGSGRTEARLAVRDGRQVVTIAYYGPEKDPARIQAALRRVAETSLAAKG